MKKLALTIVCAMAVSGAAFAQGYIQWILPTSGVTFQTNATSKSPLFGGGTAGGTIGNTANVAGGFDYILLTQAYTGSTPTDANVWDGTWSALNNYAGGTLIATNGTGVSGFAKANATPGNDTSQQLTWANGTTQSVVVVGWSTTLGTTWTSVSNILAQLALGNNAPLLTQLAGANGFFGETAFGYINPYAAAPGVAVTQINGTPGANGLGIYSLNTQLYLLPVPEPATMALAGLGGLSLLLFRRRRQ